MRVVTRKMEKDDEGFVYASWLKNYKASSAFAKRIPNDIFFKKHHAIIGHILAKPDTVVLIATPHNDQDQILGYLVYEDGSQGQVVHYAYVKTAFQKLGIGKQLFKESNIDLNRITFTHFTYDVNDLLMKYQGTYDPYRI